MVPAIIVWLAPPSFVTLVAFLRAQDIDYETPDMLDYIYGCGAVSASRP